MNKILSILPSKQKLTAMLLLSFAMSFLIVFFAQFELYLNSPADFVVGWKFLLPVLLLFTFVVFVAIFIVLLSVYHKNIWVGLSLILLSVIFASYLRFVMFKIPRAYPAIMFVIFIGALIWVLFIKFCKEKAVDVIMLLLWGMLLAMYAQLLFFNGDMVQITGDQANYSSLSAKYILNAVIWFAITITPLIIWLGIQKGKALHYNGIIFTSIILVCMQTAGLVTTAISADLPAGFEDDMRYFSYEPLMQLSSDENIVVFLLDRLDTDYMDEVLEEYPELYNQLNGFTFYKNNMSEYPTTFPSACKMLTGHYYTKGQSHLNYWSEAWGNHIVLDELKENGFTINLVLDTSVTYGKISEIENRTDNLRSADELNLNLVGTVRTSIGLSLGRLLPYLFKNTILRAVEPAFGTTFYKLQIPKGQENLGISAKGDLNFYNYIKSNSFSVSDKKVFNFMHLNCSHVDFDKNIRAGGYHFNSSKGTIEGEGNYVETTRACFEILNTYFKQMKENNVYDNTTIILLGDHGRQFVFQNENSSTTTGLLIKPKNADGDLKINSKAELSNEYFGNSLLDFADLDYEGISYDDIINNKVSAMPRYFHQTDSITYEINGDANDFNNWKLVSETDK